MGGFVPRPDHRLPVWAYLPSVSPPNERAAKSRRSRPRLPACAHHFLALCRRDDLGRDQAGDRHPEGRAGDVVEADLVEEGYALRIAAVLAADSKLERRLSLPTALAGHRDKDSDALPVEGLEWILSQQASFLVVGEELLLGVVAAHTAYRLGEIVGAERKEVRVFGYLAADGACPGQLDHGPNLHGRLSHLLHDAGPYHRQLGGESDQRHHDLHHRDVSFRGNRSSCGSDGPRLHPVDLRPQYSKADPPQPKHRVNLFQSFGNAQLSHELAGILSAGPGLRYLRR